MNAALAILGAVAVFLGLITAILGLLNQRRIRRTAGDVQKITVSVDGQMAGLLQRVDQLVASMQRQGATVPPPPDAAAIADAVKAKNGGENA